MSVLVRGTLCDPSVDYSEGWWSEVEHRVELSSPVFLLQPTVARYSMDTKG